MKYQTYGKKKNSFTLLTYDCLPIFTKLTAVRQLSSATLTLTEVFLYLTEVFHYPD